MIQWLQLGESYPFSQRPNAEEVRRKSPQTSQDEPESPDKTQEFLMKLRKL
jgi:hypothetical protein